MFIETFPEFRHRMDCECRHLEGRYLFANGGQSNGHNNHQDPPADEFECLRLKRDFLHSKLDKEVKEFKSYKKAQFDQAALHKKYPNLPAPDPKAPEYLQSGLERIEHLLDEIEPINARLAESPEARREQERNEQEAKRLAQIDDLVHKIDAIQIMKRTP